MSIILKTFDEFKISAQQTFWFGIFMIFTCFIFILARYRKWKWDNLLLIIQFLWSGLLAFSFISGDTAEKNDN
ncbi:MAG: hypothetical protein LBD60_00620 [Puniceicoccales bacterium]|nr:hypothetical protein [Puniceicoccales bacterium]